ncbi:MULTISPECIES: PP0621 family protein [Paraburkholderia]|uniref:PP0621 family protein n=1 Tax=Paraburkholderia TaxID=1822464 RepID=UPI002250ACA2|nr:MULTISPECIES: PP0621 family protein [Paraburkholderia]MCX4165590.1 PP0621 family protein [Paraburkholderia megapolitana]MDN7161081.1 deaminase [Paraburkholderia sp. CHISQ3]MDQ6498128.1 deaminase [Paraburkholderia megapolitana]
MRQIFLLILLFIVGQWLVKAVRRADARTQRTGGATGPAGATGDAGNARTTGANPAGAGATRAAPQLAEPMIRCVECGVHAPKSDSVVVAGQAFCCAEHAHRHAARPTGREAR